MQTKIKVFKEKVQALSQAPRLQEKDFLIRNLYEPKKPILVPENQKGFAPETLEGLVQNFQAIEKIFWVLYEWKVNRDCVKATQNIFSELLYDKSTRKFNKHFEVSLYNTLALLNISSG